MASLKSYLTRDQIEITKSVIISDRFVDPDTGKPAPFLIKSIGAEKNAELRKKATLKYNDRNGNQSQRFDSERYSVSLMVECTIEPDFRNAELCAYYGVTDPLEAPMKMLSASEYNALARNIVDLNGFNNTDAIEEEAKN